MKFTARITWLVLGTCFATAVFAQSKDSIESFYRCKDANGQIRIGSSTPPECIGRDTEVLNQRNVIVRVIEGEGTRSSRMAKEAEQAERQKKIEEQAQRDKVLIETYLSVEEIERLRDQRLDLLTAQLKVAEQHIATMRDRLGRLREQAARFKPYSDKPNALVLSEQLASDLVGTVKGIAVDQQTIDIKRNEQETMTTNFDRDIKRFQELKGIK